MYVGVYVAVLQIICVVSNFSRTMLYLPNKRGKCMELSASLFGVEQQLYDSIQFTVDIKTGYLYSGTVSLTATGGCRLFCSALPVRSA